MKIKLCDAKSLDIEKTFECGQCFRWNCNEKGIYTGVVGKYLAEVSVENGEVYITSEAPPELWFDYFDLDTDYAAVSAGFDGDYLHNCVEYGFGIRILRQDSWEALCSFIISQCNNITRIKGIVERLCEGFGEKFEANGKIYYSFPSAERLADLEPEDLAVIRAGYRAEYIINAAKAVASGELDLDTLKACDYREAIKALRQIRGIGEKVANCVVLFGLYHMEAFPIDVWMKRALKENFSPDFDPSSLGKYAGLAQQYIFYYARSGGK
ncbi:MAG: DNA glycosylase [Oscillospiraceae bacterium]|nr:DNA glycosylase [Oscillospiraceae bacterium]